MYHYKLQVLILSQDNRIYDAVSALEPMAGFEHELLLRQSADAAVKTADVIVCELSGAVLAELVKNSKPDAAIVFCAEPQTAEQLDAAVYQSLTDLWIRPCTEVFVAFRLHRLFEHIKIIKDCHLAQSYLDTGINSIPSLIWFKDIRGAHLKVNDSFCRAVGKTKADVEGRGHYYIWDMKKEEYEQGEYICLESEEIVLQEKKTCIFDEKVKTKHGMRQFKTYKSPIFDDNEQLIGTVGIAHDVTDLENMGAELEVILRNLPFAVLLTNEAGKIINANDICSQYFTEGKEAMIGQEYQQWKQQNLADMSEINAKGYADAKVLVGRREKNLEIYEKPIFDVFGTAVGMLCMCRDVTVERLLEKKIIYSANTDQLTDLYNRRYFYEYMTRNKIMSKHVNLFYIDLDNFKKINDEYGHQAGDTVLVMVAKLLKQTFGAEFIARVGGDEFLAVVLGSKTDAELAILAERFLSSLQQTIADNAKFAVLSASIGIAVSNALTDVDLLIRQSDSALYEAKRNGKKQYKIYHK